MASTQHEMSTQLHPALPATPHRVATNDDPATTPPVPASQAPAHGVDHRWDSKNTLGMMGDDSPAIMVTDNAPPAPSLTSNGDM
jgi:hypothetical protein